MIDVVFLLIIFFLVSSQLAKRENRIPVELPSAASGQDSNDDETPRLTLTVEADGALWLAGHPIAIEDLPDRLTARSEQSGEGLELRIRCDRAVAYRLVSPILSAAVQAGIWDVGFAVLEPKQKGTL